MSRIRITVMRIRILPFNLIMDPDPTTHLFPDLDPLMLQNDPLRLPPFHFDADPDGILLFTLTEIQILLSTSMRIRIQLPKMMRIWIHDTVSGTVLNRLLILIRYNLTQWRSMKNMNSIVISLPPHPQCNYLWFWRNFASFVNALLSHQHRIFKKKQIPFFQFSCEPTLTASLKSKPYFLLHCPKLLKKNIIAVTYEERMTL